MDASAIAAQVAAFNELSERERALWASLDDIKLDQRVAARDGDSARVGKEAQRHAEATKEWSEVYRQCKASFVDLCESLGLDREAIGRVARQF